MNVNLTYIIATRNRLPFLIITLQKLQENASADEEIIVIDGNSSDGSKDYLTSLLAAGKIHQYVSEPDCNQAHGWNKALLMARGTLIKKIVDDDVFCYNAIRKCKMYMLDNAAVDVVISNDLGSSIIHHTFIQELSRFPQFINWAKGQVPSFTFSDVHMLIRRSSLAYIGLYHTGFVMMDWEYSLRISYLKANITYYTGYNALSVFHPQSVSSKRNEKLIQEQGKRGGLFYKYAGDKTEISVWSKIKINIGKRVLKSKQPNSTRQTPSLEDTYAHFYQYIDDLNESGTYTFIKGTHYNQTSD